MIVAYAILLSYNRNYEPNLLASTKTLQKGCPDQYEYVPAHLPTFPFVMQEQRLIGSRYGSARPLLDIPQ